MSKPYIFVSCGQYLPHEKNLGLEIKKEIERLTPFEGYFAEDQSGVSGLVSNILERLHECAGLIFVMHPRGQVTDDQGRTSIRGSVWIEQEIAIAALIQQVLRKDKAELKVAAYIHGSVKMEGIRTLLHLNPVAFERDDYILEDLRTRLPKWVPSSASPSIKMLRWQVFEETLPTLEAPHIEALRALTLQGPLSDRSVTNEVKRKGLALNWVGVLGGGGKTATFAQPVPGQSDRQRADERMWEIKPEAREFLEQYFVNHP